MNVLQAVAVEFTITVLIGLGLVAYIRRPLHNILVDLCGTESRADFWSAFSTMLLIGIPGASALGYQPVQGNMTLSIFYIFRQLGQNIMGFLVALVALGFVLSFFAFAAARMPKERTS